MALSEQSSLEDSLARILGAPATPAATATAAVPKASLMAYSAPMAQPGSTSIALGAEQPVTVEPPPVAATTPIVTTTPTSTLSATTTPAAAETAAPAEVAAPAQPGLTLGYSDYYAGNEAALDMSMYKGDTTDAGVNQNWGEAGNPYGYRNEYNQYVLDNDKALADYYKSQGITDLSYSEYFGGNEEALDYSHYRGSGTDMGVGSNWGESGNPYQYRNEYNAYLAGGTPTASGTVAAASAPAALVKPVNPGSRAPWQESAQYWKDLDTYTRAGGK